MSVSCRKAVSPPPSIAIRNRLPSRMKVTAVSLRIQRGLLSAADVLVICRRAPLVTS